MATNSTHKATGVGAPTGTKALGKWSHDEDLALLISIAKSYGAKVKWANVQTPAGRSTDACAKRYEGLIKAAAYVNMTAGSSCGQHKRKATNDGKDGQEDSITQPRRKRARKSATAKSTAANDDHQSDTPAKDHAGDSNNTTIDKSHSSTTKVEEDEGSMDGEGGLPFGHAA